METPEGSYKESNTGDVWTRWGGDRLGEPGLHDKSLESGPGCVYLDSEHLDFFFFLLPLETYCGPSSETMQSLE